MCSRYCMAHSVHGMPSAGAESTGTDRSFDSNTRIFVGRFSPKKTMSVAQFEAIGTDTALGVRPSSRTIKASDYSYDKAANRKCNQSTTQECRERKRDNKTRPPVTRSRLFQRVGANKRLLSLSILVSYSHISANLVVLSWVYVYELVTSRGFACRLVPYQRWPKAINCQ